MKILKLTAYGYPEQTAGRTIGSNLIDAFVIQGWDIVTYTPTPSRGLSNETIRLYRGKAYRTVISMDGHHILHRFLMFKESSNPLFRALRYLFCAWKQFNRALFAKDARGCDVMFIYSTPPIQGAMAAMVKKFRKDIILIYNLQDIFPDSLSGTGLAVKGGILWKIGRVIENFTYRNADKIIVISNDFKNNIMAKGVPDKKIEVIYNWVDEHIIVDVPRIDNKLFDLYHLDRNKFYITYSGNIGLTQNMDLLLAALEELETEAPDIILVLIGDGAYKENVVKIIDGIVCKDGKIRGNKLSNVIMLPFQPYEDIASVFSLGDAGLIISKPGVGANSVPSKTWNIMSASRPILASFDENELKNIIEDNQCGIFTKAGDKDAFKDAILTLYNDSSLCKEMGKNGRQFVMNNLTKEIGTQKYVNVIKQFEKR